jgi:hypothetical protein
MKGDQKQTQIARMRDTFGPESEQLDERSAQIQAEGSGMGAICFDTAGNRAFPQPTLPRISFLVTDMAARLSLCTQYPLAIVPFTEGRIWFTEMVYSDFGGLRLDSYRPYSPCVGPR